MELFKLMPAKLLLTMAFAMVPMANVIVIPVHAIMTSRSRGRDRQGLTAIAGAMLLAWLGYYVHPDQKRRFVGLTLNAFAGLILF